MNYSRASSRPFLFSTSCLVALGLASACADEASVVGDETGESGSETAAEADMGDEIGTDDMDTVGDGDGDTTGDGDGDTTGDGDGDTTGDGDGDGDTGGEGTIECLDMQFVNGPSPGVDYKEFDVPIGSHCMGTNNQDITDIERVVFLGDSVSVGTPPAGAEDFYRSILSEELSMLYGIDAPDLLWKQYDPFGGTSVVKESGDFASCAEWGARNDDLITQLEDCFATQDYDKRTLVVFTMGGNDVAAIAKDAIEGAAPAALFEEVEMMLDNHRAAVDWLVSDPNKFPNGVFVVNANVYEFTDYTADLLACPAAGTAGFNDNPPDPELVMSSLNLINGDYMQVAQDFGTDVVFMFEGFCGHGFKSDQPDNVCYRGPGNANWFDLTCIHPTAEGHANLADMFYNVIAE